MFDNPKKELEELQEKLLQDEEWFEKELDTAKRLIGQQPQKKPAAAAPKKEIKEMPAHNVAKGMENTQVWTRELNFEEEEMQPTEKGVKGLLILAALETLGILAIGAYWALFLLR